MAGNRLRLFLAAAVMPLAAAVAGQAQAQSTLPTGGQVVAGGATIGAPAGGTLSINQNTNRAVINWNSFSVGQPNTVVFVQPGSSSAVLNRVTGGTSSTIAGAIQANGAVYLVNPNGIAISSSGSVQVGGGFVASTLGISTSDFMAGNLVFTGNGASAGVSNAGSITVGEHGYAALIGGTAANAGVIVAPLGKVAIGSGERATLDPSGDGFLQVALPTGATTAQGQALVSNSGQVDAAGGTVELRAATVTTAIRNAVNMSGVVAANSVSGHDGAIVLDGGPGGGVEVSGAIDTAGGGAGATGGAVRITGGSVALDPTARIRASGQAGGGSVEVGGGPHGADPNLADATTTLVAAGATIDASATGGGNGGTVSIWSNGATEFDGAIRATGGPASGDGGWVETSGEGVLNVGQSAAVSATAPRGKPGSWLLDPNSNVDITNATANDTCVEADALTCAPTADTSTIDAGAITSNVDGLDAGQNVIVLTSCTVGNTCSGAQTGNITVDAAISWTTSTSLTLTAAGGITINQPISGSNPASAVNLTAGGTIAEAGAGAIQTGTLTASSVGGTTLGGANQVGEFAATNTTAGNISLTNDVPSMLVDVVSQSGGGNVTLSNSGDLLLNGTIGAGAGTVSLTSTSGSVDDTGANDIITAAVLTGSAATGVTLDNPSLVGTLGPFTNTTSGNMIFGNGQSLGTSGTILNVAPSGTLELIVFNGGALTVGGGVATVGGAITLNADSMSLGGPVVAGPARVTLTPFDAGVAIDLGTAPGGLLGLTQASLSEVTAGVLQIGSPTAGNITITAPISAPASWNTLTLVNNGSISQQAGDSLTPPNLRVSSSGPVTLNAPSNAISTFAASATSAVSLVDGAALTIGTVDGVSGVSTSGGSAVNLTSSGTIGESGGGLVNTTGTLTTSSVGGQTLGGANAVGTFVATNTTSGNISLTNAAAAGMLVGVISQSGGGNVSLSNSGNMTLNGTIGVAGTVTLISTNGSLNDAGADDFITAGTLTGSAATGVTLDNPGHVGTLGTFTNTTSGNMIFGNGQSLATSGLVSNAAPSGSLQLIVFNGGGLTVGGPVTTSNGFITLNADSMSLGGLVGAGTARVTLTPFDAGVAIDLGTAPGGLLGLTQASLNEVTAGVLQIGSPTAGNLTITAPISAPAGWNVLTLVNNGTVSQQGLDSLTLANLRVSSSGPVTLSAPTNDISTFAASSSSAVSIANGAALTIGTVDGVNGITTTNGQIQVATKGSGAITIAQAIASGGGGEIDIAAAPGFGITNTTTSIASGGGNIVLLGDTLALGGGAGTVNAGGGTIVLAPSTTGDNILLGAASVPGALGLQNIDLSTLTAGQVQIGYRNEDGTTAGSFSGSIFLGLSPPAVFPTGQTPSVLLVTGASGVVGDLQPLVSTIDAGTLGVIAGGGFAFNSPNNQVATLAGFTDGGAGAVFIFYGKGPLTVGDLPSRTLGVAVAGGTGLASSAPMATGAGLPPNPLSGIATSNAAVLLQVTGNLVLNGTIDADAATVTLVSTGGSLDDAGANDIITAGTLTGSAATGVTLDDPNLVGTLGPFTNTTSGNVIIGNGQSLATSGLVSNAAPSGSLQLIVFNGGGLTVGGPVTTSNGFITLNADSMSLGGLVGAGTARVTLTPFDAGVAIDLGTAPGGLLGLTQASLNEVTAGVLQIGSPTAGNLTITAPISAPAGWNTLTLINNGAISEQAGDSLTVPNLRISSAGPVTLNTASNNIPTFAASTIAGVSLVDGAALTIGSVDGVSGVSTSGGSAVNLTSSGTIGESGGGLINTTGTLTTSSLGGTTLGGANAIGAFDAFNTGPGIISLTDTAPTLSVGAVNEMGPSNVVLVNSGGLALNGLITAVAGKVTLTAGGPITEGAGGELVASSLTGSSVGGATLPNSDNFIATFGGWTDSGGSSAGLSFNGGEALTVSGAVSSASGPVSLVTSSGNLTLASGATVVGHAVALATPAAFVNNAGAGVVTALGGSRWLVYSGAPAFDTFGGLNSGNTAIWSSSFASRPPLSVTQSGDRYIFGQGQTLTVTTTNVSKVYGLDVTAGVAGAFTIGGFAPGVAGVFLANSAATTFTGTPLVTSLGSPATASVAGSPYAITGAAGSLTPLDGYSVSFLNNGALIVIPATLTASIVGDPTKAYDGGTTSALVSGNFALSGFVAGQGATVSPLTGAYNSANVASATTVTAALTAGEFTANAGTLFSNYTLPTSASGAGAITPATLTASIVGDPTKIYDGTTTAALVSGNFGLSGFIAGQGATVSALTGAYNSPNVVSATTVTAALTAGEFTANAGTLFSNYTLPTTASGAGAITPATLTASIVGDPTKVYDGGTTSALVSGNFALSGFVAGQGATVSALSGTYNSANVASATTVTAALTAGEFTANAGALFSNYTLPTSASGAGAITPATLTASIVGDPTKVYDGGTTSALVSGNFALSGFVAGQGATVSALSGTYNSANVASATTVTAALTAGEFTANAGTLFSNYTLPTTASGAGAITPATLTASIVGDPTKVYDGTTVAALVSSNFGVSGFVAGQGATLSPLTGAYNSPNVVSATTVTAALTAGEFTANAGTLFSNYTLPTTASGAGAITPATLTASIVGDPTKVYDGTTVAALVSSNFGVSGFVAGQGATLSPLTGAYNSPNVVSATTVTAALTAGEFTANAGTLFSNYTLPTSASGAGAITPATLTASIVGDPTKVYDGGTTSALVSGNFALSGFVAGQGATVSALSGTYNSANVANATTVTAALTAGEFTANAGALFSNYTLPTTASGAGAITPATLTASIVGDPTKVYDGGTTSALVSGNFALSGFVAGQGATVSALSGTYNSANVASATTVTAALTAGEFTANASALLSNYTLPTAASGAGAITPRPITVTANSLLRLEDEPNPPLTFTVTTGNLVNGDSLSGILATTATIASPIGSYPITEGTLAATQNYSLSFVGGELVVTSPDFGVSADKFFPWVFGLAFPQNGPPLCLPGDVAASIERAGSVVIFGPQDSTNPSAGGSGCSGSSAIGSLSGPALSEGFDDVGERGPSANAAAAQALRPAANRPVASRMAAAS